VVEARVVAGERLVVVEQAVAIGRVLASARAKATSASSGRLSFTSVEATYQVGPPSFARRSATRNSTSVR